MHLRRNALQIAKLYTGFTIAVIVLVGAGALAFASYERGTDLSLEITGETVSAGAARRIRVAELDRKQSSCP